MIALTVDEIDDFFKIHKEFKDFMNEGEIISERNIKKLINICRGRPNDSIFCDLVSTIKSTKQFSKLMDHKIREFLIFCKNSDNKDKIIKMFDQLFILSMYMRGWDGKGPYPMKESQCSNFAERYSDIEKSVNSELEKFFGLYNGLSDGTKMLIRTLPLMKLNDKDNSMFRSTNEDEGLTFYHRIQIVQSDPNNLYGCMRLSSNHLAMSAQYYHQLLTGKQYFDPLSIELIT